ncbi:hypothetical protein GN956_G4197 [Arapaima gigas]
MGVVTGRGERRWACPAAAVLRRHLRGSTGCGGRGGGRSSRFEPPTAGFLQLPSGTGNMSQDADYPVSSSRSTGARCHLCGKVFRDQEAGSALPHFFNMCPFIPKPEIVEATPLTVPRCGLDHLTQVMGLHPHYLQAFLRSQFYLLQVDGPLPLHWRHYIAIMAAARHRCSFLVKMHVQEFYQMGVCVEWLKGLRYAPQRLRNLNDINKILAHRPWLITKDHIQVARSRRWLSPGVPSLRAPVDQSPGTEDSLSELEALVERMKELPEEGFQEEAESTSVIARFVEDATFGYQSFARHDPPAFCAQEYSWEDHGFPLVNRLYSDIGLLLDEKFRTVCNLTYYSTASHERVDASTLRRALFNYVHCIYGIRYDDYDYGQVNQLLERNLKLYIKTVTCYPERTTHSLYEGYWRQFHHSEKVHVILLLMEARMQAELLYALRAITSFMT